MSRSFRPHRYAHAPGQTPPRDAGWSWFIVIGSVAVTAFVVMALYLALRGRDAGAWGLAAMVGGFALTMIPAIAPLFSKQRPAPVVTPGPLSAKRAAFISISSIWMALYVLAISNVHRVFDLSAWPRWAGIAAVAAAALPIGGVVFAALRFLTREADEYQRLLLMRAAVLAAGVTLCALTLWGLLELYVGAPHMSLAMVLAPFCIAFAITNWWLRGRV